MSVQDRHQSHSTSTVRRRERLGVTIDRLSLRLSAGLLLVGQLLYILVTLFHTGGEANNHPAIFTDYAGSESWEAVHVGQFLAMALIVAGMLVLCFAVHESRSGAAWAARLGAASAVAALTLYGVLQAVDGVGNKQVDHAWVSAHGADKAARFASAEAMRWLEWGVRSYHDYALGFALVLLSAALLRTVAVPRTITYMMGLSGIAYLVQGWVVGSEGFSRANTIMILVAWILSLAWMAWLAVIAWRTQGPRARSPG